MPPRPLEGDNILNHMMAKPVQPSRSGKEDKENIGWSPGSSRRSERRPPKGTGLKPGPWTGWAQLSGTSTSESSLDATGSARKATPVPRRDTSTPRTRYLMGGRPYQVHVDKPLSHGACQGSGVGTSTNSSTGEHAQVLPRGAHEAHAPRPASPLPKYLSRAGSRQLALNVEPSHPSSILVPSRCLTGLLQEGRVSFGSLEWIEFSGSRSWIGSG
jgi:hypothetical protein